MRARIDGYLRFCKDHDLELRGYINMVVIGDVDGGDGVWIIESVPQREKLEFLKFMQLLKDSQTISRYQAGV